MLTYEVHLFLKIKLKEKNHIKWGGGGGGDNYDVLLFPSPGIC